MKVYNLTKVREMEIKRIACHCYYKALQLNDGHGAKAGEWAELMADCSHVIGELNSRELEIALDYIDLRAQKDLDRALKSRATKSASDQRAMLGYDPDSQRRDWEREQYEETYDKGE